MGCTCRSVHPNACLGSMNMRRRLVYDWAPSSRSPSAQLPLVLSSWSMSTVFQVLLLAAVVDTPTKPACAVNVYAPLQHPHKSIVHEAGNSAVPNERCTCNIPKQNCSRLLHVFEILCVKKGATISTQKAAASHGHCAME